MIQPSQLFPGRVAKRIKVIGGRPQGRSAAGLTDFSGQVPTVAVPEDATAYGRTVRMHEADHLKLTRPMRRTSKWLMAVHPALREQVFNIVEDCRITRAAKWNNRPECVQRDAAVAAIKDLRSIIRHARKLASMRASERETHADRLREIRNAHVGMLLRAIAIQRYVHGGSYRVRLIAEPAMALGLRKDALDALCDAATNPASIPKAALAIAALLTPPKASEEPEGGERSGQKAGIETKPGEADGAGIQGRPMDVIQPPRVLPCDGKGPKRVPGTTGASINKRGLATALHSPTGRPFVRREVTVNQGHGSWCFDASGSMGVYADRLMAIAAKAPGATVGFYSLTNVRQDRAKPVEEWPGRLCIYAQHGRRIGRIPDTCQPGSGNGCDLAAVRWLLKQPGPRYLVSDLEFCGEAHNATAEALRLVRQAVEAGQLTVLPTYSEAEKMFNGRKGGAK